MPIIRNIGPPSIYFPSRRKASGAAPDALMIQGFATGGRAMEWIGSHLERAGVSTAVPPSGGILGYLQTKRVAHAGAKVAKALRSFEGTGRVWLIGHSIGGLISRYAVQAEDTADRVAGVITIGTPHRGTVIAAPAIAAGLWMASRAPFDVLPRSKLISDLNLRPWPEDIPLISIYSPTDLLCLHPAGKVPFEHQYEHVNNLHFKGLGHTELLWNRDVIDAITAAILGRPDRRRQGESP